MTPPTTQTGASGAWLLIIGLLLGAGLLVFITYDGGGHSRDTGSSANVITLTDENWEREVVQSSVPVLVDFYADWCGPCREMAPTISRIAAKYQGKVKVGKLNVDKAKAIAGRYGVESLPTVHIFKGGDEPALTFVGARSESEFARALDRMLK